MMQRQPPVLQWRRRPQAVPQQLATPLFSFRRPAPPVAAPSVSLPIETPHAPLPVEAHPTPPAPVSLPPGKHTTHDAIHLTPSELNLIINRRLQNLNLPDTPHLLLAERLSTSLTTLTSLLCKLHILQAPQVTALRTNNYRLFSRIRLLSLLNLPAPRLLLYPLLRYLPALHWLLAPFRAMAVPFLLDGAARFAVSAVRRYVTPRVRVRAAPDLYADLTSLRDHIAEKLRHSREHVGEMIAKAGADLGQIRQDIELKIPPALALPPSKMPYTPVEKTVTLQTPVRGRSFLTPVKGRAFRRESADARRGLQAVSEDVALESPSLTLLPQSIARQGDS